MSLHLLAAGPIVVTADASLGSDAVRVIAWQDQTIPTLFPGEVARKRPGHPKQYLLLTNRRELGRAFKRAALSITYPMPEDVAGADALYALVASECLKVVTALDWSTPTPDPAVDDTPAPVAGQPLATVTDGNA